MKAVLFDLDGALHDLGATIRAWLAGHGTRLGLPDGYAARFIARNDQGHRPKAEVPIEFLRARRDVCALP